MADHITIALAAAVKALTQVVAPSVDSRNPLAVEQLRLVAMYLDFLAQQRPNERRMAWKNLKLQCELSRQCAKLLSDKFPQIAIQLQTAVAQADQCLQQSISPVAEFDRQHAQLSEILSLAIAKVNAEELSLADTLQILVVFHAKQQLLLHRVWYLSYGFEAHPEQLPCLEEMLAEAPGI
jgi:hypothetical protein